MGVLANTTLKAYEVGVLAFWNEAGEHYMSSGGGGGGGGGERKG